MTSEAERWCDTAVQTRRVRPATGMWLRLTQGHTRDRAKLASTLHACSVFLAAVARMKMVGLFPLSAIPPRGSSLLATLGVGHTPCSQQGFLMSARTIFMEDKETIFMDSACGAA